MQKLIPRTEAEAFRMLVIVMVGAAVVIAAALAIDPLAGAIVLALELVWASGAGARGPVGLASLRWRLPSDRLKKLASASGERSARSSPGRLGCRRSW